MDVLGQSGCIRAKVVVVGKKWLYSGITVVFGEKVVVFGQSSCIRAKCLYSGKSGCIWAKMVIFEEVVLFG